MKILVTGSNGQLGYKIRQLLEDEHELVLTDYDQMDITNEKVVREVVGAEKPDLIIHAAAYTKVDLAEEQRESAYKINVTGTENVAKAARDMEAGLIYISTDYVFDGEKEAAYSETDSVNPLSYYGMTKFQGEEKVREICKKYYILRVSWLFGELPNGYQGANFVETMIRLGKERSGLTVVNDQVGSPTYTKDLVEVMGKLIDSKAEFGLYHFSGSGECSWYDFSREIFAQTGIKIDLKPIPSEEYLQKAKRPGYSYLSKAKIEKELGFKSRTWKEMLGEYLAGRS